ncbi:MAG TPA: hypothetical protein VGM44_20455 [Polyangiaceae bacterium]
MSARGARSIGAIAVSLASGLLGAGCAKFQQARECGAFVKTVNAWIARPTPSASAANDPKAIAAESRRTAQSYDELSKSLGGLHVQSEELLPRVQRYQEIANSAAGTLRDVADALDHGDLEKARQKRVQFDTVALKEGPLVKEINGLCR